MTAWNSCLCVPVQKLNRVRPLEGCQTCPVEIGSLDLASLDSVKAFASKFNARSLPLALLICNAGVMAPPKRLETQDGCEQQFQVKLLTPQNMFAQASPYQLQQQGCLLQYKPHTCYFMHALGTRLAETQCMHVCFCSGLVMSSIAYPAQSECSAYNRT